ncbi:Hypothetical predicted protein [Paramuricea clavata]|uniref:Uncharacterized protein n=1 Tax=Paramuricea clavata TaxID=317549 RepID=A0A6S7I0D5_PARCT|nr:Hypothetical predicted protein [Paramuricea clavata]
MSETHFYLTLPSNASLDVFPDNKTGSYLVKLPHPIDLNGNWEVGLYSISYPNTWYTLRAEDNHIYCSTDGHIFSPVMVDCGYYETVQDLIAAVNRTLEKKTGNRGIALAFDPRTTKMKVTISQRGYMLGLATKMSAMLGFGGIDMKIKKTTTSPYVADLLDITTVYIYCDIVRPQIVGDVSVHMLRTIHDIVAKTFNNIQYVPVQTKSFEDIQILLRDGTGAPVPFERGTVIATLYFRKQSYFA